MLKGSSESFGFSTKGVEGLIFEAAFYSVEGDSLTCVVDPATVEPNEYGMIIVDFDATVLDVGGYVLVINVSAADSNHVLSNGEVTAIYSFEFNVANG